MKFNKSTTVKGVDKELKIVDGKFVNAEGEIVDVVSQIEEFIGDGTFELSITQKIND